MIVAMFPKLKMKILRNLNIRSAAQMQAAKMTMITVFFERSGRCIPAVTRMSTVKTTWMM